MQHLRTHGQNLKKSSSTKNRTLKLKVTLPCGKFEASGEVHDVNQQFEKFLHIISSLDDYQTPRNPTSQEQNPIIPILHLLFDNEQPSSVLTFRTPPPHDEPLPNWVLLLLLGYRELRQTKDVSATVLIQSLQQASHQVPRLDRMLHAYLTERFMMKGGRGKGGFYRLTGHGVEKACEKARELAALI